LENVARNVYECLFILDSNRYARDPGGVSGTIPQMIEGLGGTILANRLWNEQRLAYPIDGHLKGTYWLTYFEFESTRLPELDRACHLNEAVVRKLVLKIDPRLVDAMVAHARGEIVQPVASEEVEVAASSVDAE
jgi:small subunit ribosomal protein S6